MGAVIVAPHVRADRMARPQIGSFRGKEPRKIGVNIDKQRDIVDCLATDGRIGRTKTRQVGWFHYARGSMGHVARLSDRRASEDVAIGNTEARRRGI